MKKKYIKACKTSKEFCIHEARVEMLDDLSVLEKDVLKDSSYITKYYPIDLALRNKGNLTLMSPHYVKHFSDLLKLLSAKCQYHSKDGNDLLPNKNVILKVSEKDDVIKVINQIVYIYLKEE